MRRRFSSHQLVAPANLFGGQLGVVMLREERRPRARYAEHGVGRLAAMVETMGMDRCSRCSVPEMARKKK